MRRIGLSFLMIVCLKMESQQIGNYINNGSFEATYYCHQPNYSSIAKFWSNIDSNKYAGSYCSTCVNLANVPINTNTFQYPKNGNAYVLGTFFDMTANSQRAYLKNRLKKELLAGKVYCVKFYVNIANTSTYGMDGFGIYFGSSLLDTISKCTLPLSYISPQIQNANNNIISDTLNWVPITGTFVASGLEKYALVGNFKSNGSVATSLINPTYLPTVFTDACIDAVSCIEVNLPAYAGLDKSIIIGDSAYIGRESDFAVDKGCIWYKLPNMTTSIDTISGLWVKPTITTTYVVRQELDCSSTKWDTVVVHMNLVGLEKLKLLSEELKVYPIPAQDFLELKITNSELFKDFNSLSIYNSLGQLIREEEISFKDGAVKIKTDDFQQGVYSLQVKSKNAEAINKRFVISR